MTSSLLDTYEEEYRDAERRISEEMEQLRQTLAGGAAAAGYKAPPASGPGSRGHRCANLTRLLHQLKELISNMEYESNELSAGLKQAAKERIGNYRTQLLKLEDAVTAIKSSSSAADRTDLLGNRGAGTTKNTAALGAGGDLDDETAQNRLRMMENTAKVKQGSNTLQQAERLLNDTEQIANDGLTTLRGQTETMHHIAETTIAVDEEISEARKVLVNLQRAMIKHKLILIAIICVLLFLIIVAIYVSTSKGKSSKPVQTTQAPATEVPTWAPPTW